MEDTNQELIFELLMSKVWNFATTPLDVINITKIRLNVKNYFKLAAFSGTCYNDMKPENTKPVNKC